MMGSRPAVQTGELQTVMKKHASYLLFSFSREHVAATGRANTRDRGSSLEFQAGSKLGVWEAEGTRVEDSVPFSLELSWPP